MRCAMLATRDRERVVCGLPPRRVPVRNWEGILVIHKGMTAIVHNHLIDIGRDEQHKIATVRVVPVDKVATNMQMNSDIKEAADLLAERAQRFLGRSWTVKRWAPAILPAPPAL